MMQRRNVLAVFGILLLCSAPILAQLSHKHAQRHSVQANHPHAGKCGYSHLTVETLQSIASGIVEPPPRPQMMASAPSPSGKFLIHFDTAGIHQVDATDNNLNGVPDYIDSVAFYFDEAYRLEVDILGYPAPASDNGEGGSDAYDVYVQELNDPNLPRYGYAQPGVPFSAGGLCGRSASYIGIDNNFSPLDSTGRNGDYFAARSYFTTGVDAVKITAVHEFHHAIQFSAYGSNPDQRLFHEMTSTWLEYRLYPEIEDYMQYLPGYFADFSALPFGSDFSAIAGYTYNIFGQYIQKEFGDGVFKRMWELSAEFRSFYNALDSALNEAGGALSEQWCGFLPWLYHTAERAEFGQYFDNAANFPPLTFYSEQEFSPPSISVSGMLAPLEVRFFRLILPIEDQPFRSDTIDIALGNVDTTSVSLNRRSLSDYSITCTRGPGRPAATRIAGTDYYLEINALNDKICSELYLRDRFLNIDFAYPNPYSPQRDGLLFLPVPDKVRSDKVNVTIYNEAMEIVYTASQSTDLDGQRRIVKWNGITNNGNRAASGVYIYVVDGDNETTTGKVALIAAGQ